MRNFWILLKNDIVNTYGINALKKKFATKKAFLRIWMPVIAVLIALAFFALIMVYMYGLDSLFVAAGDPGLILIYGVALGSLISFMTTISKANAYLFESKDFDLLMSFPIQPRVIILEKLANLLLLNYISFGFLYIPSVIWFIVFTGPGFIFYPLVLLIMLIAPLVIVTVCSVISYFLGILLSKFKYKNLLQTIGMLIFFIGVMFISFSTTQLAEIENDQDALLQLVSNMRDFATNIYPPAVWAEGALMDGNIISLMLFVGISIIPFGIFVLVVEKNFVKANARARVSYTDKNFKLSEQESASPLKSLIKKELKRYFSNSMVVLNTIVGPVMGTFMIGLLLFSQEEVIGSLISGGIGLNEFTAILIIATTFMNGMTSTTASAISLEGKYFWITKSAPVKEKTVFNSKVFINFIISIPFTIINVIIVMIVVKPSLFMMIPFILIPTLINLILGYGGLYVNLLFPRLDWKMEVKVVKQSVSVLVTMVFGMLLTVGITILGVVLMGLNLLGQGLVTSLVLVIILMIVILFGVYILLSKDGVKRYNRIKG